MTFILKLDQVIVNMFQYAETKLLGQEVQEQQLQTIRKWWRKHLNTEYFKIYSPWGINLFGIETRYAHHAAYAISCLHKEFFHLENRF